MTQYGGREQAGAGLRHDPQIDEGHNETRVGRGIDEVAVEEHGRAHAHGLPLDGSDQWLVEGGDGADEVEGGGPALWPGHEILQIIAGAKGIPLPCDQHGADVRARGGIRQRGCHGAIHGRGQRIFLVGAVDHDFHDALILRDCDMLAHGQPLLASIQGEIVGAGRAPRLSPAAILPSAGNMHEPPAPSPRPVPAAADRHRCPSVHPAGAGRRRADRGLGCRCRHRAAFFPAWCEIVARGDLGWGQSVETPSGDIGHDLRRLPAAGFADRAIRVRAAGYARGAAVPDAATVHGAIVDRLYRDRAGQCRRCRRQRLLLQPARHFPDAGAGRVADAEERERQPDFAVVGRGDRAAIIAALRRRAFAAAMDRGICGTA